MTVHEFPRDHGSLANLDKDHHPQYLQQAGDLLTGVLGLGSGGSLSPKLDQNSRLSTDLNSSYPDGLSFMSVNNATGWPVAYGALFTWRDTAAEPRTFQLLVEGETWTIHQIWMRRWRTDTGAWTAWTLVAGATGWVAPTLLNGWANYGSGHSACGYRMKAGGTIELRGLVRNGTADHIFTLPAGYYPSYHQIFIGKTASAGDARIDVRSNGQVWIYLSTAASTGAPATWTALDAINFSV